MKTTLHFLAMAGLSCFLVLSVALGLGCANLPPPPGPQVTAATLAKIGEDQHRAAQAAQAAAARGDETAAAEHLARAESLAALHARAAALAQPSRVETAAAAAGDLAAAVPLPAGSLAAGIAAVIGAAAAAWRAHEWRKTARAAEIMALAIETAPDEVARPVKLDVSRRAAAAGQWLTVNRVAQAAASRVKRA